MLQAGACVCTREHVRKTAVLMNWEALWLFYQSLERGVVQYCVV